LRNRVSHYDPAEWNAKKLDFPIAHPCRYLTGTYEYPHSVSHLLGDERFAVNLLFM